MDQEDYKRLLEAILNQTFDDYIKLYHPQYRQKKYLEEAFLTSKDLVYDDEFLLENIFDDEGQPLSFKKMASVIQETERPNINIVKKNLAAQCLDYWAAKETKATIPETVNIAGYTYEISYGPTAIDHKNLTICLERDGPDYGLQLYELIATGLIHHLGLVVDETKFKKNIIVLLSTNQF